MNVRPPHQDTKPTQGNIRNHGRDDRLSDHPRLDAIDINVTVQAGDVKLNGFVHCRGHKWMAEDCAEPVAGVKNVQNNRRV